MKKDIPTLSYEHCGFTVGHLSYVGWGDEAKNKVAADRVSVSASSCYSFILNGIKLPGNIYYYLGDPRPIKPTTNEDNSQSAFECKMPKRLTFLPDKELADILRGYKTIGLFRAAETKKAGWIEYVTSDGIIYSGNTAGMITTVVCENLKQTLVETNETSEKVLRKVANCHGLSNEDMEIVKMYALRAFFLSFLASNLDHVRQGNITLDALLRFFYTDKKVRSIYGVCSLFDYVSIGEGKTGLRFRDVLPLVCAEYPHHSAALGSTTISSTVSLGSQPSALPPHEAGMDEESEGSTELQIGSDSSM